MDVIVKEDISYKSLYGMINIKSGTVLENVSEEDQFYTKDVNGFCVYAPKDCCDVK